MKAEELSPTQCAALAVRYGAGGLADHARAQARESRAYCEARGRRLECYSIGGIFGGPREREAVLLVYFAGYENPAGNGWMGCRIRFARGRHFALAREKLGWLAGTLQQSALASGGRISLPGRFSATGLN